MSTNQPDKATGEPKTVRAAIKSFGHSNWGDVEQRLLLRAVAVDRSGDARGCGLALEVVLSVHVQSPTRPTAIDAGHAVIPLTGLPVERWAMPCQAIWSAAARNTRRLIRPTVTTTRVEPFQIWLLTGDRSTSAVSLDIGYFARALAVGPAQAAASAATGWWSVLSESAAVILISENPDTRSPAAELVSGLRSETENPLPANLFRYDGLNLPRHPEWQIPNDRNVECVQSTGL